MKLFENECRPAKNDPAERDLTFSLPRPRPPPTLDGNPANRATGQPSPVP